MLIPGIPPSPVAIILFIIQGVLMLAALGFGLFYLIRAILKGKQDNSQTK